MDNSKIFLALKGQWIFDRQISPGGTMIGEAVFKPAGEGEYYYEERGILTLDHGDVVEDVKRAYRYQLIDGQIHVYYADGVDAGKLFHVLEFFDDGKACANHLCGEDQYDTKYVLNLPDGFQITHRVKGPKKDYTSVTNFKRYP